MFLPLAHGSLVHAIRNKERQETRGLTLRTRYPVSFQQCCLGRMGDRHELCTEDEELDQRDPSTRDFWSRVAQLFATIASPRNVIFLANPPPETRGA